jgi:hypothetical protein
LCWIILHSQHTPEFNHSHMTTLLLPSVGKYV